MFCVILKEQIIIYKGDLKKAIQETIKICIATDNLKEYLLQHKKEVEKYMFVELSQKEIIDNMVDDAREQGMAEATTKIAKALIARNQFTYDEIASMTGLSVKEICKLAN